MSGGVTPERLRHVEELYHLARERENGEREAFLAEACRGDAELLCEITSLLDQDSGGPMAQPVLQVAASLIRGIKPGTRFGPYEILSQLGEGGMGVVYKARDTRLGRSVAIKTAHEEFSGRFQREARAISALNHPHICTLHDIGPNYLVMELVEGETLADRLKKGRLPVELMLCCGAQIADALTAAHSKGIIHRDLKPSNIMITRAGIKVLDFGLAKVSPGAESSDTLTDSHTIVGTPAYMAPEQLEGKECDARTDIFALGLVLYEMAAGRKVFTGNNRAALIADIMCCEPVLDDLSPPHFAHIVERCLAKDPENRWQTARDVKLELEFQSRTNAAAHPSAKPRRLWYAIGVAAAMVILAGAVFSFRVGQPEPSVVALTSYPGNEEDPSFSPDGNQIAFAWNGETERNYDIYVKQVGGGDPLPLTKNAAENYLPRWSPDGKWIAFVRGRTKVIRFQPNDAADVYVIPALGGGLERKVGETSTYLGEASYGSPTLDWSPDGHWLVISRRPSPEQAPGLALLAFDGGEIRQLTSPPAAHADGFAAFAPDGHALAFLRAGAGQGELMLLPLSSSLQPAGPAKNIPVKTSSAAFCWSADSRDIIFSSGPTLWRMPASGSAPPRPLSFAGKATAPAVSRRGDRMAFLRSVGEYNIWSLDLDETGRAARPAVKAFDSTQSERMPRFSPDGTRVVFESDRSGNDEIWVCLSNGSSCTQMTSYGTHAGGPSWSPDGNWIAFDVAQELGSGIEIVSSGGGKARRLTKGILARWSRDGKWIYFFDGQIRRIPVSGGEVQTVVDGFVPELSPDGKWLYYSGLWDATTYLRRMPMSGGKSEEVIPEVGGLNFAVVKEGIWYLTPKSKEGSLLKFYDFASKSSRTVYHTAGPYSAGLTVSPNGQRILFTQVDRPQSQDLMLVENFR
jgi:serine/threonine protein kinase/Tol biopolymer transport system component